MLATLTWSESSFAHLQLSIPWIWSVKGLSTQSPSFPNDVRGFDFINRSLPNVPPEGTIHGAFTANPVKWIFRPISGITTVIRQSYKKHSQLALCSLLNVTYGFCFRQEELTDRRLVELEGQSPVVSIFLSLIHLSMPDPHRLEVGFLNPFQTQGRDNPEYLSIID